MMEERKKAGLPVFNNSIKLTNRDVIETNDNTIIISDFSNSLTKSVAQESEPEDEFDRDDEENTQVIKKSEINDAEITKSKSKIDKECSLIEEKLSKLVKQKKALELTNTKMKKNFLKSKRASGNCKSTKKFNIKKTKNANRKKNTKKKID